RTLTEQNYVSNLSELVCKIWIEAFSNQKVSEENISLVIRKSRSNSDKQSLLYFAFPEFRYSRFSYKGEKHLLCVEVLSPFKKTIFLLPDLPSFSPAPKEAGINLHEVLRLGADNFTYVRSEDNGQRLIFQKNNSKDINVVLEKPSTQAGHFAPEITGINLQDRKLVSLATLRGKYVFVDFWSTSCGPCIADFPALVKLYNSYDKAKIEFIGMADERQKGKVKELLDNYKIKWPTLISNIQTSLYKGYHISFYPTSFLIAPDGKIVKLDLRSSELKNVLDVLLK
uniref:TlpA family protein disulfide reductase n=1 Tax=Pedobacter sp. TaxID=1411316 RepID=UPI003D7FD961